MEKKDSIFAGLTPASQPAPAPAPAPRAAAPDPEVAALKQKIESLERTIAAQAEKKAEAAKPPAVPSPPAAPGPAEVNAQFLLARIGELDRRLEEFTRSALVSSAQLKNIEESKISARREIEDLLKVVREQQKYSELDRQMHDQLEKSWRRVEELEKKLMDFYGAVLAGQQKKEEIDGLLSRDLGGKIEALAARLDLHAQVVEKKLLAQDASLAAAAGAISEEQKGWLESLQSSVSAALRTEVAAGLARTREETLSLGGEQAAAVRAQLEEQLKDRFELLRDSVAAELERSRGIAAGELELFKKEFARHLAGLGRMLEDFSRAARENLSAAEGAAGAIAGSAADAAALFRENFEKVSEALGRDGGKFLSELEERNRKQLETLSAKYTDALTSASALDFIGTSAGASLKQLAGLREALSALLGRADKERLRTATGVSGQVVREVFAAMEALLYKLGRDAAELDRIKKEAEDRAKGAYGGDGK